MIMKKILVIQLAKMGDLFQTNSFLKELRKKYPNSEISLIYNVVFGEVVNYLATNNNISINLERIVESKDNNIKLKRNSESQKLIEQCNNSNYDILINLNSNLVAKELIKRIKAVTKFGFYSNNGKNTEWLNFNMSFLRARRLSSFNLVDIWKGSLNLKSTHHNNQKKQTKYENKLIVIQLGSRNKKRQYPVQSFAKIIKNLISNNNKVYLTGVENEKNLATRLLQIINNKNIINLIGKTNLKQLVDIIKDSSLVITTDTGTMHIAANYSIPTIALFLGPALPTETLGYNKNVTAITPNPLKFPCYPCKDETTCPYNLACHYDIKPETVFDIIENRIISYDNVYTSLYDQLGQYLIPFEKRTILYDELLSFFNRSFAAEYFFDIELDLQNYLQYFKTDNFNFNKIHSIMSRELKLYHTLKKRANLKTLEMNLNYLKNVIVFQRLTSNQQLIKDYLSSVEKFLNEI